MQLTKLIPLLALALPVIGTPLPNAAAGTQPQDLNAFFAKLQADFDALFTAMGTSTGTSTGTGASLPAINQGSGTQAGAALPNTSPGASSALVPPSTGNAGNAGNAGNGTSSGGDLVCGNGEQKSGPGGSCSSTVTTS